MVGEDDVGLLASGDEVAAVRRTEGDGAIGVPATGEGHGPLVGIDPHHLHGEVVGPRPVGDGHGDIAATEADVEDRRGPGRVEEWTDA